MSYWVGLIDANGAYCQVEAHQEGGTFQLGGTSDADLNVLETGLWLRPEIRECGLDALDAVAQAAESAVARVTEEPTYLAGGVVVIDTQGILAGWWPSADGADAGLEREKALVLFGGDPIQPTPHVVLHVSPAVAGVLHLVSSDTLHFTRATTLRPTCATSLSDALVEIGGSEFFLYATRVARPRVHPFAIIPRFTAGSKEADINITYNYAGVYGPRFGWNLRDLDGKRAGDTVPDLERMVNELGTERDPDYWAKTPGNAGHALSILLGWARQHPDGRWVVS